MPLVTQWINGRVGPGPRWSDPKTTALSIVACPDLMGVPWGEAHGLPWLKLMNTQVDVAE